MSYRELTGNIFNSTAGALVNTVNCVGAMGKGIALEFRRRFPDMFAAYQQDCLDKKLVPGRIYPYLDASGVLILNFAIKNDWKQPSRVEWIESCLERFVAGYKMKNIHSAAFPWMGAMNGGIPLETIQAITRRYLQNLEDIDIEVYTYDPNAPDVLFERLKEMAFSQDPGIYYPQSNLKRKAFDDIIDAVRIGRVKSLSRLIQLNIAGKTSIDKLYLFLKNLKPNQETKPEGKGTGTQLTLF